MVSNCKRQKRFIVVSSINNIFKFIIIERVGRSDEKTYILHRLLVFLHTSMSVHICRKNVKSNYL